METLCHYKEVCKAIVDEQFKDTIERDADIAAGMIIDANNSSKVITVFGNGGSAADSQHLAGELICTYQERNRPSIPAIALTTDSSVITAWSNDFSYESVFSRQLEGLKHTNGLSIGLSTSGSSRNVLKGLDVARSYGAKTILISGNSCNTIPYSMHIMLPSENTAVVQTLCQVLYHSICERIDALLMRT